MPPRSKLVTARSSNMTWLMAVNSGNDVISQNIARKQTWEPSSTQRLLDMLAIVQDQPQSEHLTMLDIGANIGWYTLVAALSGLASRVIAVEAASQNADRVAYSLCTNQHLFPNQLSSVTIHNVGLGAVEDQDCNLFDRSNSVGSPMVLCNGSMPAPRKYFNAGSLHLTTVDSIVNIPVDIIKIDVEGNELLVATGWNHLFGRTRVPQYITSEFVPNWIRDKGEASSDPVDYLTYFSARGYTLKDEHGGHLGCTIKEHKKWLETAWKKYKFHGNLVTQLEIRYTTTCQTYGLS